MGKNITITAKIEMLIYSFDAQDSHPVTLDMLKSSHQY